MDGKGFISENVFVLPSHLIGSVARFRMISVFVEEVLNHSDLQIFVYHFFPFWKPAGSFIPVPKYDNDVS